MFANLSTAILYYWSLKNNIDIPIIIPILLAIRSFVYIFPGSLLDKIANLQQPTNRKIEYLFAVFINVLLVLFLYFNMSKFRTTIEYTLIAVVAIYLLQLAINLFYLFK